MHDQVIEVSGLAEPKGLGWWPADDERDEQYPLRDLMTGDPATLEGLPDFKYWHSPYCLDQDGVPQCTEYALRTEVLNGPRMERPNNERRGAYYAWAQDNDEWAGSDYEGTSVRAIMKAGAHFGDLEEYRWANFMDAVRWLALHGPLVVGTEWTRGMSEPHRGKDGKAWIEPTGERQGGHARSWNGVNVRQRKIREENNWGRNYGDSGFAWISF